MAEMEITGLDQVQAHLQRLAQQLAPAIQWAIAQEAHQIMDQAQELVPVLTGLLKSTGAVETEQGMGATMISVKMSFGGGGLAGYAIPVHERVDVHHPHGQHHFLSQPFYAATQGMLDRLVSSIHGQVHL